MRISQLNWDLCFIAPKDTASDLKCEVDTELAGLDERISWFTEAKEQDGLCIVIAEGKGLTCCTSEDEFLSSIDPWLTAPCWDWLSGYQLQVIPQVDAGSCKLKGV
ncbi:hypothetical protein [Paenibacillus sp. J22TS3]|uniref:hypothetical protein n=1 Tax=Paenibacillus sp. J22TS3 TaxID=2807192 RepID=UPI001B051E7D|nr:hypothetical protein [Paenibacillus sp. J22TS3]GIP24443.1 hypothetical protein J22TS3_47180 [Paenibacillus sp. J22TS3]